jgi:GNAT superfamily N-acetyltransferase
MLRTEPVTHERLGNVNLRCLPDGGSLEFCLRDQGAIGIGAWDDDLFVGSLWFYRLDDDLTNPYAPPWVGYNRANRESLAERKARSNLASGPFLGLDCVHVGRLIENGPDGTPEPRYLGRGIGTRLLEAAIAFAKEHGYAAVLHGGGPDRIQSYNHWAGSLPARVPLRHGFTCTRKRPFLLDGERNIDCPPEIYAEMAERGIEQDHVIEAVLYLTRDSA